MASEISARARAAAEAFRFGHSVDDVVANWQNSVRVYFDEVLKAVKDVRHPVTPDYFESGLGISESPLFAMLDPKALHCSLGELGMQGTAAFARLEHDVFTPYVAAWTKLVQALLVRFPSATADVQAFASKLQAMLGAVRMMATVEGAARGENFERVYGLYHDVCAAFRTVGIKVSALTEDASSGSDRVGVTRRHYERYCLPSERLAELFGVERETISRWKRADTNWGMRFRNAKDSLQQMERLAREYSAVRELPRRVSFDERYHGVVNPERPHI